MLRRLPLFSQEIMCSRNGLWFPTQTLMPNSTGFQISQGLEGGRQLGMAEKGCIWSALPSSRHCLEPCLGSWADGVGANKRGSAPCQPPPAAPTPSLETTELRRPLPTFRLDVPSGVAAESRVWWRRGRTVRHSWLLIKSSSFLPCSSPGPHAASGRA